MTKRQTAALAARTERLQDAVFRASDRLANEYTPLIIEIGDPTLQFIKYGDGYGIVVAFATTDQAAWRVGQYPRDKFFGLKLVPEARMLALPVPREEGSVKAETFVLIPFDELVEIYSPAEIRTIVSLINKIESTFGTPIDNEIRLYDFAMYPEDPNVVTYPRVVIADDAPAD